MKKMFSIALTLFAFAVLNFSVSKHAEANLFHEGDRYRPGTCTIIDEEGPLSIAICTKKVVDGPCIKEVKCEQPIPE